MLATGVTRALLGRAPIFQLSLASASRRYSLSKYYAISSSVSFPQPVTHRVTPSSSLLCTNSTSSCCVDISHLRSMISTAAAASQYTTVAHPRTFDLSHVDPHYLEKRDHYRAVRRQLRTKRRVFVGPHLSVMFENYETVWIQMHEMIQIEKVPEDGLHEEIDAYAPLIPRGSDLVITIMFEISPAALRERVLRELGHVEDTVHLEFGTHTIVAQNATENDVERTTPDGKTSAVHFLRFPFTLDQVKEFQNAKKVQISIHHPKYMHSSTLSEETLDSLRADLQ
mmetsp:Transcript_18133/g.46029  ORF Transcript_18133/g.46029 Transcript_18133/m.46029 type:complete len:283 (-) Transcript_18133:16-864(-)